MRECARKSFEKRFEIGQASTTLLGILQEIVQSKKEHSSLEKRATVAIRTALSVENETMCRDYHEAVRGDP